MKLLHRRRFLHLAVALPALPRIARAQAYPTRPITMIVPFAAGGPTDSVARIVVQGMRAWLGQPIIIENIGAADGTIGVGRLARALPDGYTIDMGAITTHVLPGALYQLQYDLLNDFQPITPAAAAPYLLYATNTMPAKDLAELISWLKAGRYDASVGVASIHHAELGGLSQCTNWTMRGITSSSTTSTVSTAGKGDPVSLIQHRPQASSRCSRSPYRARRVLERRRPPSRSRGSRSSRCRT
jgi:tripartite-type tricarboxylate transporter receptor subunit TctC